MCSVAFVDTKEPTVPVSSPAFSGETVDLRPETAYLFGSMAKLPKGQGGGAAASPGRNFKEPGGTEM